MRRSICYCEPNLALAGNIATRKFCYTTASSLPKGTRLKFDLLTTGREIDWEVPSSNLKAKSNVIWAEMPNKKVLAAKEILEPHAFVPTFEFVLPSEIKAGETIIIVMGNPEKVKQNEDKKGNRAQTHIQRRRPFYRRDPSPASRIGREALSSDGGLPTRLADRPGSSGTFNQTRIT